jgi:hypothetical protein
MSDTVDQEVEAIKAVLQALSPLSEKARASVLEYVTKRLELPAPENDQKRIDTMLEKPANGAAVHIKQFKEQKNPRSANEMAALVAYYLANVGPTAQRKPTINLRDIETHFKIAEFPLPQHVRVTLQNAKAAGYFDLAGDGEYRLNAVGHNLVAHTLPRGSSGTATTSRGRKARKQKRRITKKRKSRSS